MSFIRAKEIPPRSGNFYDYEVKTVHEGSKVRQVVIRYIGRSGTSHPSSHMASGRSGSSYPASYDGKQGLFITAEGYVLLKSRFLKES